MILSHKTGAKIDWKFKDEYGRNIVSRTVQCFENFSYENKNMIQLIYKYTEMDWKRLCNEEDYDGKYYHYSCKLTFGLY